MHGREPYFPPRTAASVVLILFSKQGFLLSRVSFAEYSFAVWQVPTLLPSLGTEHVLSIHFMVTNDWQWIG